ncbi:ARC6/PARC6 family protein [Cylindrospermopsis raciborskii]|uniref:ARC6/PARC6 family protein n=1 Tax=Cylindrospermopsis raciborskii TaxID=77022 RepID=UPI001BA553A3|nr:ARC6/PARC6 family protein [Cylindrospermopsis raciborskii]
MLKKIIFCSTCLSLLGCQGVNPHGSISSNLLSSPGCPDKPTVSLNAKNVENLTFDQGRISKSNQVSVEQHVGYTFAAIAGDKLSYSTDNDVCIWVFTPDTEIVKGKDLLKTGQYTIQVGAPQGVKNFNLEVGLGDLQTNISPTTESTPTINLDAKENNLQQQHDISQEDAIELIKRWYAAKPQIFGPPFDGNLVDQLTTGNLHTNTIGSAGSVDWLKENQYYYQYNFSNIEGVIEFSNSQDRPYIKVRVSEERYLHGQNGIDQKNSGVYTDNFIYFFEKENGTWKIYDYKKIRG